MNGKYSKSVAMLLSACLLVLFTGGFSNTTNASPESSSAADSASESASASKGKTGYKQKQFYISTFRAVHYGPDMNKYVKLLEATKEAGINLVENAILAREETLTVLDACDAVKIKCMAQNITADNGFSGMGPNYPAFTEASVKSVVKELKKYKMLEGYYIWDEVPKPQFGVAKELQDYFRKYDSKKLIYSILFPSYGEYTWDSPDGNWENSSYANYVNSFIETVNPDVLGFDYYPFWWEHEASLTNNNLWRDLGLFRKKAIETNKPLWFYFQGVDVPSGLQGHMNREKISVQMYAALAYGAKTVSYFTSLRLLTDELGNKTPIYNDIKSLNKEVLNLGNLLFDKQSKEMYHFGILPENQPKYYLDQVSDSELIAGAPDNSIVSVFGDNSSNTSYVLVVNKDYKNPMTGNLTLKTPSKVKIYDKANDTKQNVSNSTSSIALNIPSGDCVLYIIKPAK